MPMQFFSPSNHIFDGFSLKHDICNFSFSGLVSWFLVCVLSVMYLMQWDMQLREMLYFKRSRQPQSKLWFNFFCIFLFEKCQELQDSEINRIEFFLFHLIVNFIILMFKQRQPASSKNGNMVITMEGSQPGRSFSGSNATSWTKLVLDLYPPGTSIRFAIALYIVLEFYIIYEHAHPCTR